MTSDPSQLIRLLSIMARLRDPERGCEWDLAQDFTTIAPYTIEEAYEVAEAIERSDMEALRDELGDLLLQVVFHARMAHEAGEFAFEDVARAIADKMEARHPHIFGEADGRMEDARWEALKASERESRGETGALDGIAAALPALMRSGKLQKRAARVGFEWHDTAGPRAKLAEELEELDAARTDEDRIMEAGDVLFVAVNLIRRYGVEPEQALRASNAKFERRFREMERLAAADGKRFADLLLDEQEAYWQAVKRFEREAS